MRNWILPGLLISAALLLAGPSGGPWGESIRPISSTAAEANHVYCSRPCSLRSLYITTAATPGFLMTVDATAAPAAGGAAIAPLNCVAVPASTSLSLDYGPTGEAYSVGLVAIFSTTGCFTNTASATAYFKARTQ